MGELSTSRGKVRNSCPRLEGTRVCWKREENKNKTNGSVVKGGTGKSIRSGMCSATDGDRVPDTFVLKQLSEDRQTWYARGQTNVTDKDFDICFYYYYYFIFVSEQSW